MTRGPLSRILLLCSSFIIAYLGTGCGTMPRADGEVTLAIAQTERGVMIWLPESVLFEFGKDSLDEAESEPYLARVAQLLRDKSGAQVALEGHTDNVGSTQYNQKLSERRAMTVRDRLQTLGVPDARMTATGLGLTQPIAPNDTETGRKLNRRVEIVLLGERLESITRDERAGAFEEAFARLERLLEEQTP